MGPGMATVSDLIQTLANALGLPRRLVEETAGHLCEAKMLPDGEDAQATVEHAGALLLASMAAPFPKAAPNSVRNYGQLPLDLVTSGYMLPDGKYEGEQVADDDPLKDDLNDLGETFGEFLDGLLSALIETPDVMPVPVQITVGGGLGTSYATVDFLVSAGGIDRACVVRFNLASFGGGQLPDDAAVARLDSSVTVPGAIFDVLREFFSDVDCPRAGALAHGRAGGLRGD